MSICSLCKEQIDSNESFSGKNLDPISIDLMADTEWLLWQNVDRPFLLTWSAAMHISLNKRRLLRDKGF